MHVKLKMGEVRKLNKELRPEGRRFCNRCGEVKEFAEFPKMRDGLSNKCKVCHRATAKVWRDDNRDKHLEYFAVRSQGGRDENQPWPIGWISYAAAHSRIYATYGPASNHPCVDCGEQGAEWSYRGGDPDEFSGLKEDTRAGTSRIVFWSGNPAFYEPRDKGCHIAFDQRLAKRRADAAAQDERRTA